VLSFSNTAVTELRHRLNSKNPNLSQVVIKTAHAFSNSFVAKKSILTDKDAQALLSKAIKSVRQDCRKLVRQGKLSESVYGRREKLLNELGEQQNLKYVLSFLAVAQAAGITLAQAAEKSQYSALVPHLPALKAIRTKYAAIKKQKGVIDFGDMLYQATDAIRAGAPVPFTHILVDEYQDCSPAQVQLLVALANSGCSIMVFGDPGQAIYGFGGSSYTPLSTVLDGVTEYSLPKSHRLTVENAALASAILGLAPDQAIQATRHGPAPILVSSGSELEQAERIADDIEQLIAAGTPPEQIVILGRIKALLHPVEQQLLTRQLNSARMQCSRDTKHAIRVLRLVHLVGRAERNGDKFTVEMLKNALPRLKATDDQWTKGATTMKKVHRTPSLEGRYRQCGKQYLRLLGGVRCDRDLQHDINRWEPHCRAHSSAKQMRDALRAMPKSAVITGTIHAAKGLEWAHVFIVGATDGYLPLYHAREKAQLGEERNLLYVAATRARETMRFYHAPCNHAKSRQRFETTCSFLTKAAVLQALQLE
jgi:DNA helicase-2/ATP-dependent DNA helicase PcrA